MLHHERPFTWFAYLLNHVTPVKTRYPGFKSRTAIRRGYTDIRIKLNHVRFIYKVHIYRYHNSRIPSPGYYTILAVIFVFVSIVEDTILGRTIENYKISEGVLLPFPNQMPHSACHNTSRPK